MLNTIKYPLIRLYRWVRFRHGHGVHSPFAFTFINDVVEEKNAFYAYENIIGHISRLKLTSDLSYGAQLKYQRLLFRISYYYKIKQVLMFGCSDAEAMLYTQAPSPEIKCHVFDFSPKRIDEALVMAENITAIDVVQTSEDGLFKSMEQFVSDSIFPKMIIFDRAFPKQYKQKLFRMCLLNLKERTFIIFNGINQEKELMSVWKDIEENTNVAVTFDFFKFGIAVLDPDLKKRRYKLSF